MLPDSKTCAAALDSDADLWDRQKCFLAQAIAADPNGAVAKYINAANNEIAAKDYNGQHVGALYPTYLVKSFHPRSNGHAKVRMILQSQSTITNPKSKVP